MTYWKALRDREKEALKRVTLEEMQAAVDKLDGLFDAQPPAAPTGPDAEAMLRKLEADVLQVLTEAFGVDCNEEALSAAAKAAAPHILAGVDYPFKEDGNSDEDEGEEDE